VRGPDGREVTKTFPKRVQADQWAKEREADKLRGTWIDPRAGRETVGQWVQRYLKDGAVHKRATTMARDKAVLNHWFVPALIRPGSDGDSGYWIPTICWSVCWAA